MFVKINITNYLRVSPLDILKVDPSGTFTNDVFQPNLHILSKKKKKKKYFNLICIY